MGTSPPQTVILAWTAAGLAVAAVGILAGAMRASMPGSAPREQGVRALVLSLTVPCALAFVAGFFPLVGSDSLVRSVAAPGPLALRGLLVGCLLMPLLLLVGAVRLARGASAPGKALSAVVQCATIALVITVVVEVRHAVPAVRHHALHRGSLAFLLLAVAAAVTASFFRGWRRWGVALGGLLLTFAPLGVQLGVAFDGRSAPIAARLLCLVFGSSVGAAVGLLVTCLAWPATAAPRLGSRWLRASAFAGSWVVGALALGAFGVVGARFTPARLDPPDPADAPEPAEEPAAVVEHCLSSVSSLNVFFCCEKAHAVIDALPVDRRGAELEKTHGQCWMMDLWYAAKRGEDHAVLARFAGALREECDRNDHARYIVDCALLQDLGKDGDAILSPGLAPFLYGEATRYDEFALDRVEVLRARGEIDALRLLASQRASLFSRTDYGESYRALLQALLGDPRGCEVTVIAQLSRARRPPNPTFFAMVLCSTLSALDADATRAARAVEGWAAPGPELAAVEAEMANAKRPPDVSLIDYLRGFDPKLKRIHAATVLRALATPPTAEDLDAVAFFHDDRPEADKSACATREAEPPGPLDRVVVRPPSWVDPAEVLSAPSPWGGSSFDARDMALPVDRTVARAAAEALESIDLRCQGGDERCAARQATVKRLARWSRLEIAAELVRLDDRAEATVALEAFDAGRPQGRAPWDRVLPATLWLAVGAADRALRVASRELEGPTLDVPWRTRLGYTRALAQIELGDWEEAYAELASLWNELMSACPPPQHLSNPETDPASVGLYRPVLWLWAAAGIHLGRPPPTPIVALPRWPREACHYACPEEGWLQLGRFGKRASELWGAATAPGASSLPRRRVGSLDRGGFLSTGAMYDAWFLAKRPAEGDDEWTEREDDLNAVQDRAGARMREKIREDAARLRGDRDEEAEWRRRRHAWSPLLVDRRAALAAALLGI